MTMRKILILIFCLFAAPLWAGPADALLDKLAKLAKPNQMPTTLCAAFGLNGWAPITAIAKDS